MSCNSPFCFTLIRKTLPIYSPSSNLVSPFFLSRPQFLSLNDSAPLSHFLLFGDSPDFPQKSPIPQPSFPVEIPQIPTPPEVDPSTPPELPSIIPEPDFPAPPGPEFPIPPLPSPPGIDVPVPPHKPPDIEPPRPGSPVPGPDILPPLPPEELPPRPPVPEIVTSPSPTSSVPRTSI